MSCFNSSAYGRTFAGPRADAKLVGSFGVGCVKNAIGIPAASLERHGQLDEDYPTEEKQSGRLKSTWTSGHYHTAM